jgi:predicted transcriptional regulator
MQSIRTYDTSKDKKQDISLIPAQSAIDDVLDPLCHKKRFEILKAVSGQSMSFSALSRLTDLRGGNLLFHLQKLLDSGLIIQQYERGDYMITGKGFRIMEGISTIYFSIVPEDN